jgi:acetolactate synthase-1/2/3 large subunit
VLAGTDCWFGGAEEELRTLVEALGCPVVMNGMGRGLVPADHPHALSRARGTALGQADLVLVVGTALDFRIGYGAFGAAKVVHVADSPEQVATHAELAASVAGDLRTALSLLLVHTGGPTGETAAARAAFLEGLQATERGKREEETELLTSDSAPLHPARVYGALREVLDRDAVVIGDGGDFVSFAGRYVDSYTPGCWLDPGPYGCLGTGMGYAAAARLARPSSQVVTLLGDGAAGFGLMDVDTLLRHDLPVVMVVGNNGIWALEKYPMQMLYDGWDTITDLRPGTRYDEVVTALGGGGETVSEAAELVPALERAFDSGVPYLVNVLTDPEAKYPRKTMGI